ncbi:MAG: B12-binding domain-containing radical SAM protein [Bacteroidetes bacterium]|nr:B12-binding domain-containing radical SAM protein [Bacteroidota bacterium]
MNILLVYPQMPDTFYAMKHFIQVIGKKAAYPPLGLLTIASLLPEEWSKKLVDINVTALSTKDLEWADFVFLSAMNVQEESVREIVELCKRTGVKIVAGGPLFTHEHERFPTIDHFILNEAEITLPLFLEDLKQGTPQPIYKTNEFADVALSPLPAFELVNMDQYIYSIVQYSRGCPYMCDFCDVTALFGRRPRTKNSDQIIQELEAIDRKNNVRLVLFADDNLIGNKRILKNDLLPAIISWRKKKKPGFFFATQLTINLADDEELMNLLIEAGFRHVFIGIETPDEEGLKESMKIQNLKRDQLENIRKLHKAGFIISAGFIVGFDTDTTSIFQQQIDFIQQSGIPLPIVNILKAPPGTELFKRMKKEGRLSKQFAFAEGETNIVTVMDEKTLYSGFIELITNIYLPEKSYQRLIQFFSTYQPPKTFTKVPAKYGLKDMRIVFRILYLLGVKDKYRKFFWKLILWSILNKPKYLDLAILYGIMVYQMHKTYLHIKQNVKKQNKKIYDQKEEAALNISL